MTGRQLARELVREAAVAGAGLGVAMLVLHMLERRNVADVLAVQAEAWAQMVRTHTTVLRPATAPTRDDLDAVHRAARDATLEGAQGLGEALWAVGRKIADDAAHVADAAADALDAAADRRAARREERGS